MFIVVLVFIPSVDDYVQGDLFFSFLFMKFSIFSAQICNLCTKVWQNYVTVKWKGCVLSWCLVVIQLICLVGRLSSFKMCEYSFWLVNRIHIKCISILLVGRLPSHKMPQHVGIVIHQYIGYVALQLGYFAWKGNV